MDSKTKTKTNADEVSAGNASVASESTPSDSPRTVLTVEEVTDLLQRTQANFENYRKQVQAQNEEIRKMAAREMVIQVLPILDNLGLALKSAPPELNQGAFKDFLEGMGQIYLQFLQVLHNHQVMEIETAGKDFDPYYHEALMKIPSELPANKIIDEFQKGFTMHGKVLRHARVKISAGPARANSDSKNNEKK